MITQQNKSLFLYSFFGVILSLFIVTQVSAVELSKPQLIIKETSSKLQQTLQSSELGNDFVKINTFVEKTINPHVDFKRLSALVLGKLWRKATPSDKTRFNKEFKTLLVRTYSRAFLGFKDWTVKFLPLKLNDKSKKIIVRTEILQKGLPPLAINYRMLRKKGQWRVYDIIIEGVSLVTNYRSSIRGEFKRLGSLKAVIELLAERNAKAFVMKK